MKQCFAAFVLQFHSLPIVFDLLFTC